MSLKVLIVEDEFVEATSLSITLKKAGHHVDAIAKSVDQALNLVRKSRPDIVLVDIFLNGELSGIDLGHSLDDQNIPFIYLSANSNPTTLEDAVLSKPYGFLTKPFREREILLALNIATYRFQKSKELELRQEQRLQSLLLNAMNSEVANDQKLSLLIRALTSFLPF